jgi:hypothetical protein
MAQKKVYKKKTKNKKVNVSQSVVVNVLPKSKAKKSTKLPVPKQTILPQQPFSITELAKLLREKQPETKSTQTTTAKKETQETQTSPFKEEIKVDKLIPLGRLKIDESVLNKFNASRPSIPARNDISDVPAFQGKPINEYFKPPPEVIVPPKKDSKVKKVVVAIENKRMGQEDNLAQQIRKDEASRQRQQNKLDYYNTNLPFASESSDTEIRKPLMTLTPEQLLIEGKKQYEEESLRRLKQQVIQAQEETRNEPIPKRPYVKSGKYSKKKPEELIPEENISLAIQEE